MKSAHRFDYSRFGEALVERGLIDRDVLNHVLQQCNVTRALLPEVLVRENLVSDWEVSRVSCELYHLPFLTVEQYGPANSALDGYDLAYLRHYALVPLERFGGLVTVIMPGLVPSEVLEGLRPGQGGRVLPVVGSVVSNRRWLEEHFAPPGGAKATPAGRGASARGPIPSPTPATATSPATVSLAGLGDESGVADELNLINDEDWSNIFDAGDEAVQLDLKKPRA